MLSLSRPHAVGLALAALSLGGTAVAQSPKEHRANWALSNRMSREALEPLVYSTTVIPNWIKKTDRFWYLWRTAAGRSYVLVDPEKKVKRPLFDHDRLAAALTESMKKPFEATNLNLIGLRFDEKEERLKFFVEKVRFEWDPERHQLTRGEVATDDQIRDESREPGSPEAARPGDFKNSSPDKQLYVYAQDHNLHLVDTRNPDATIQLSKDGERNRTFEGFTFTGQFRRSEQQEDGSHLDVQDAEPQVQGGTQTTQMGAGPRRSRPSVVWS